MSEGFHHRDVYVRLITIQLFLGMNVAAEFGQKHVQL